MIDAPSLCAQIKLFLEESEAARKASAPLKEGSEIGLQFRGFPEQYHVVKMKDRLAIYEGPAKRPDWTGTITPAAVAALRALENPDIGDLGVEIFKRMARGILDPEGEDNIRVHLDAGFFTIMRHGYLGILPLGGPKVAQYLAQHGLKNVSGFRRVIKKLRGKDD
jgi:hypothetical protein